MCLHTLLAEPSWPSVSHPVPMPEVTEPLIIAVSHLLTIDDPQTLSLPGLQIYWSVDNPIIHYSPLATRAPQRHPARQLRPPRHHETWMLHVDRVQAWLSTGMGTEMVRAQNVAESPELTEQGKVRWKKEPGYIWTYLSAGFSESLMHSFQLLQHGIVWSGHCLTS